MSFIYCSEKLFDKFRSQSPILDGNTFRIIRLSTITKLEKPIIVWLLIRIVDHFLRLWRNTYGISTLSSQYAQPQQAQDYLIISCIPFNSMLFVQLRSGLSRASTTSFVKLVVTMFFAMLTNYAITGLSMVVPGSSVIFTR
uniref:Uncharacterized protein n=1 Tax=Glossina palpalis gambiensis TaxID=67801 RepID=A0A1B0BW56_9MUSC